MINPKHVKEMGVAVRLYMWLTSEIPQEQVIKYAEVKTALGLTQRTYNRWVSILTSHGYIKTKRTPYGIIFTVRKGRG